MENGSLHFQRTVLGVHGQRGASVASPVMAGCEGGRDCVTLPLQGMVVKTVRETKKNGRDVIITLVLVSKHFRAVIDSGSKFLSSKDVCILLFYILRALFIQNETDSFFLIRFI